MRAEKASMANSTNTPETTAASAMVLRINTWKKLKVNNKSYNQAAAMPPGHFRMILKKKKIQPEVASVKPQAASKRQATSA
jgi:hypothetical protein